MAKEIVRAGIVGLLRLRYGLSGAGKSLWAPINAMPVFGILSLGLQRHWPAVTWETLARISVKPSKKLQCQH